MKRAVRRRLVARACRGGCLFLAVVSAMVLVRLLDLESVLDPGWADSHLKSRGTQGVCAYVALAALCSAVGVPRQALSALAGYAFGALWGALWASAGLAMGCAMGFFFARFLAKTPLQQRFGPRLRRLDAFLTRNPFSMALAVRCFPFGNNALTNLLGGITSVPALPFIAGSAVGYVPQTLVFALLGSGIRVDPVWRTLAAASLFVLATAFGLFLYRRFTRFAHPAPPADNQPF